MMLGLVPGMVSRWSEMRSRSCRGSTNPVFLNRAASRASKASFDAVREKLRGVERASGWGLQTWNEVMVCGLNEPATEERSEMHVFMLTLFGISSGDEEQGCTRRLHGVIGL